MERKAGRLLRALALVVLAGLFTSVRSQDPTDAPPIQKVPVPPMIIVEPTKSMAFRVDEGFAMECVASGEPEPEYSWKFNNEPFDPSGLDGRVNIQPGVGTLIFQKPKTRDEGLYQCFATNKYGVAASVIVVLRKADLQSFIKRNTTHTPQLGAPLVLVCNPPLSYPPPEISWTLIGTSSEPVMFDDRVSKDPKGNLNFANVIEEDRQPGKGYACEIWNGIMRRQQRGSFHKINPLQGGVRRYPPVEMYTDQTNQRGLRGETWRVKCIVGGNPTPRVTWLRDGGPMIPRYEVESFGQELVIRHVQYADAGKFECEGINEEAQVPFRKSFKLSVESAPQWVNKPESVSAAETQTVQFRCSAEGRPSPIIAWFINGRPIAQAEKDPRMKVEGGLITFSNLTINDPMVFQCNASNRNGYIFTNAYLNVQAQPPVITNPPTEMKVAEGQKVVFTCTVFGSPKPLVVWSKGNEQLTGGNFKVLDDGSLQIEKVSLVDAGEYTCTATNKFDTTSSSGTLKVRRRTLIQTGPMDVMVNENTEVKFTCTATTDAEEINNLQIIWKRNGQEIDFKLAQRMFKNDLDNSLTISGTMCLDTAAYSCMATNGLDEDEVKAQLIVQGVPDPPEKIRVLNCTENAREPTATIEWQPANENYAPILNFIIQYNTTFAPDQWVTIADNITQNERSYTMNLSPYANYTFRVLARNKIGLSYPGMVSKPPCRTEPRLPTKNPDNVIGEGDEPNNLVIFWTPVAPIDQNGDKFTYSVRWKRLDQENAEEGSESIEGGAYYHHLVSTVYDKPYIPFEIMVQSQNSVGAGPNPTPIIGYSGEDTPLITVGEVRIVPDSLKGTQVEFEWDPIVATPASIRGFFRGYRVEYEVEGGGSDSYREVDHIVNKPSTYPRPRPRRSAALFAETTTPIPMVRVLLTNLRPASKIIYRVRILTKYYAGKATEDLYLNTPEGEPGPPRTFDVTGRGPTFFDLRWAPPQQSNGVLIGYNISYQTITGLNLGRLQYRETDVKPTAITARLTALKPDTNYRVFLSASTAAGKGEPIFLDAQTTHAGPPSPPTFDFVGDVGETFVDIAWVPSRGANPGSVFYVQYRARGQFEWVHSRDEALRFSIRISDLDPGTTYQMRVVAKNGMGLESAAEWQEVITGGIAPGGIDIGRSFWFYGIFLAMLLITLLMVGFILAKRSRDAWWEEEEREREIQFISQMEQVKQMEQFQAGSQENVGPGVTYGDSDEGSDNDSEEEGGFRKPEAAMPVTHEEEQAPPLPEKKGYPAPLPPKASSGRPMSAEGAQAYAAQPADPNAYPADPNTYPADPNAYPADPNAYPADPNAYPDGYEYPEGYDYSQYPEGQYYGYGDGQYYPGYDDGSGYPQDGQYYGNPDYDQQYAAQQYAEQQQYPPYDGPDAPQPNVQGGQLRLDTDPKTGGSSFI